MKLKKITALFLASALALTGCSKTSTGGGEESPGEPQKGHPKTQKISLVLDWTPNTNHTGLYVAREKGYFAEEGLDVDIIQPPEDGSIGAVATGQAQFGVSYQENLGVALASDNPMPATAIATIINHNTSGIISLLDAGIETFKDLEGKKYATWGNDIEQSILKFAVESEGGDFSKVELVPNTSSDAISLLQSGAVDAVWVFETWDNVKADLDEIIYNYVPFAQASTVLDYYTPILIANDDLIQKDPETVQAFMRAVSKGYNYAIENPQDAADILLAAVPELDSDMVHTSQDILALYYKGESDQWGYIEDLRWTAFYDFLYAQGLIDNELGSKGYTNEFLPA